MHAQQRWMRVFWAGVALSGTLGTWVAQAQTGSASTPGGVVGRTQSRVVVYRPVPVHAPASTVPWTVRLLGQAHVSLVAGAFSSDCLPVGATRVSVLDLSPGGDRFAAPELRLALEAGQTQYWQLTLAGEPAALTVSVVPEAQARQALQHLRPQASGSSPLAIACQAEPSPLEVQAVARQLLPIEGVWAGDGLALTPAGALRLEALAAQWQGEFARVDRVRVLGHAQEPAQHEAAWQRVREVQQTLAAAVGRQWRYQLEVLPLEASPLAGCGGLPAARLAQACPLASRAVAVEVLGVRR